MFRFYFTGFLLLLVSTAFSQNIRLSGRVLDVADASPLAGVNLRLSSRADTTRVFSIRSDDQGRFRFDGLAPGSYRLQTNYLSYVPLDTSIVVRRRDTAALVLRLRTQSNVLKNVEIQETQVRTEQRGDTTEYNAKAFKVNPDATTEDLVTKMPGVTVENGQVKAQGENVRRVTVDGKEFFGDDATLALRNLPAEIVDKIQVFDRPSDQAAFTGFDDGQTQKTMNVVTRMGANGKGTFGRAFAGAGTNERYNAGVLGLALRGKRRLAVVALTNNVNKQNFSMQDVLGIAGINQRRGGMGGFGGRGGGGGGNFGGGGGMGGFDINTFLVGQQGGINTTHSLGFNYSDEWWKKVKLSASYFFNRGDNSTDSRLQREFYLRNELSQFYTENNLADSKNFNHRFSLRLEYEIDSMNTLTLSPRLNFQDNNSGSQIGGLTFINPLDPLSRTENDYLAGNNGYSFSNSLVYRHKFMRPRRTIALSVNTDLNDRSGDNTLYALNEFYNSIDTSDLIDQRGRTASDGQTFSGRLTYTEPAGKYGMLELNYNPSRTDNFSQRETNRLDPLGGEYTVVDSILSNRFDNNIRTQRGGLSYLFNRNKLNISAGVDYQYLELSSVQSFPRALTVEKPFRNWLPNASLRYRFSRTDNLRINYRTQTNTPSVTQLQDVIDNTNPLFLNAGNPNLKQAFSHSLNARYNRSNTAKGRTFFAFLSGTRTDDYIANSTLIAPFDTVLAGGVTLYRGAQLSQPVNVDGYWNVRSFATYGMPVKPLKSNLNLNGGLSFSRAPGLINGADNRADTWNLNGGLVLGSNISEKVDFTVSYTGNYNIVENSLQPQANNNYFNQLVSAKFNWLPWKGLVLNTDLTHTLFSGLGADFNQDFLLWNAAVGYKFLKKQQAELRLSVFDLLGQNNSISRTVTETYLEDNETQVLTRYFMLTFTYNLRQFSFGGAGAPGGGMPPFRPRG